MTHAALPSAPHGMHEALAARLMSGLALDDAGALRGVIREALANLRDIVATMPGGTALDDLLADARSEAAERLEAAGIALDWPIDPPRGALAPAVAAGVRAALRDLATLTLTRDGASRVRVVAQVADRRVHLDISDNAVAAVDAAAVDPIASRIAAIGGALRCASPAGGLHIHLRVPLA